MAAFYFYSEICRSINLLTITILVACQVKVQKWEKALLLFFATSLHACNFTLNWSI